MIPFREIAGRVSARDAAEFYGLRIYRNRRALCPWHDDTHPDLAFYGDGRCYCHACHEGGDSIALTAKLFGLGMGEAARKLVRDFGLQVGGNPSERPEPVRPRRPQRLKDMDGWDIQRLIRECADVALEAYNDESAWDDPAFTAALRLREQAAFQMEQMADEYIEMKRGKVS